MDSSLIVFGIRGLLRLTREGTAAFEQFQRDKAVLFPDALVVNFRDVTFIRDTFFPRHADKLLKPESPLARFWSGTAPAAVPGAIEALYVAAVRQRAEDAASEGKIPSDRPLEIGGAVMIKQWADGKGPVGPIGRVLLSLADLTLEYVGANPSLIGIGGNGEKLVGALATNLSAMIPDDGSQFGPKTKFAERLTGVFLRASLETLNAQPGLVLSQEHFQQLVQNTLPPIINALPGTIAEETQRREVFEALLGPAASAAIATIARNPSAFLGSAFDANKAIGALTTALLEQASKTGLKAQFTEAGFIGLYHAALGVAAARPSLFFGRANTTAEQIATDLFAKMAAALKRGPAPFNQDLGAELGVAVLETLEQNASAFFDPQEPWENVAAALATQVVTGLKEALAEPGTGRLATVLSNQQLIAFARIFLQQASRTPGMIAGGRTELQAIVRGVAAAMAADDKLLLAPDDWLRIAAAAAEVAAANPERLFALPGNSAAAMLGTTLIRDVLELASGGRGDGAVLFGPTLREAIITLLRAGAGRVRAVADHRPALRQLAQALNELVRTQPGRFGSAEWLALYRGLIGAVLDGTSIVPLADERIVQILKGGVDEGSRALVAPAARPAQRRRVHRRTAAQSRQRAQPAPQPKGKRRGRPSRHRRG